MKSHLLRLLAVLAVAGSSGGFLVSNSSSGGKFVFEEVPADRRPINIRVDSDPLGGVT